MNTLDALFCRKSIRNYTGEKISRDQLELILKAAYSSPVARARYDSLHLTVIEDTDLLTQIDRAAFEYMGYQQHPLHEAPTFILVSSSALEEELGNVEYSNAAIQVHSMGLAATELGIGCCYIWGSVRALNTHPELIEQLNLPEGFVPCCGIVLGITNESNAERKISSEKIATNFI
ncbi:MAG: nitroreductase family protein [Raoultibacter sp.]|jgi:FMN reductase (NADPH)